MKYINFSDQTVGTISNSMSEIFPTITLEKFTTHLFFKLSDYFRKSFRTFFYSVDVNYVLSNLLNLFLILSEKGNSI